MKKILIFISLIICIMPHSVFAAEDIPVFLNGQRLNFDQPPIIRDDSVLVPVRTIFEELGMTVKWVGEEQKVVAEKDGSVISLTIDSRAMVVSGREVELVTPPIIENKRTLVPLRAVSEAAGAEVLWDGDKRTVSITARKDSAANLAEQALILTNLEREKKGLGKLVWDNSLADAAQKHCEDMINRDFFSHNNPDGETPFDRLKKAGISYLAAGENVAVGYDTAAEVVEAWMNSPTHRANILNPNFKSIGIAVIRGGSKGIYWAQEYALLK